MSGKLDTFSEKQARGSVQSGGKFSKTRRLPFADITNIFDSKSGLRGQVSFPPPQSPTLSEIAMHHENGSKIPDAAEARSCSTEALAPIKNRRPVQSFFPALSSHSAIPSSLHGACSSSRAKSVSGVPPAPLPSSHSHLRAESRGAKSSRRRVSSDDCTQRPFDPDLCVDHSVNHILPHDFPTAGPLLPPSPGLPTREPLSTSLLPPKTHKLAHGQLVILPSRSVLVDFREGERRKGRKGDEVMVVSPNGDQVNRYPRDEGTLLRKIKIRLFSAPHLSTPCCLAEPVITHSLNELPVDWYKLYEQANKVIEHMKRNVPKVLFFRL
jgi:hypothetical protein